MQQGIDQSRFAMVDVGDDRDVAQILAPGELGLSHDQLLSKFAPPKSSEPGLLAIML